MATGSPRQGNLGSSSRLLTFYTRVHIGTETSKQYVIFDGSRHASTLIVPRSSSPDENPRRQSPSFPAGKKSASQSSLTSLKNVSSMPREMRFHRLNSMPQHEGMSLETNEESISETILADKKLANKISRIFLDL